MQDCSKQLMWGWICNYDPKPNIYVRLIFLSIDLIFLGVVVFFYYYSNLYRYGPREEFIGTENEPTSIKAHTHIKITYLGLFLLLINDFFSHLALLVYPNVSGYFLVGYKAYISLVGLGLFIYGMLSTQFELIDEMKSFQETPLIRNSFILLPLEFISVAPILLPYYLNFQLNEGLEKGFLIASLIIFFAILTYMKRMLQVKNKILGIRINLNLLVYAVLMIFIIIGSPIIIQGDVSPESALTWNTIEYMIYLSSLWAVITSIIIYMDVRLPEWLLDILDVSYEEYQTYLLSRFGVDPPNTINLTVATSKVGLRTGLLDQLDAGFLTFSNLDEDDVSNTALMELIKSKINVIESFDLENSKEKFFIDRIAESSNLLIVANEMDDEMDAIVDRIYRLYNWDIELDNDKIIFNRYPYSLEGYKFSLIFSGNSVWNDQKWLYLFLFPKEVRNVFFKFLNDYFEYIEEMSKIGPCVMILFFEEHDGTIQPINYDPNHPNYPNGENIRLFEFHDQNDEPLR